MMKVSMNKVLINVEIVISVRVFGHVHIPYIAQDQVVVLIMEEVLKKLYTKLVFKTQNVIMVLIKNQQQQRTYAHIKQTLTQIKLLLINALVIKPTKHARLIHHVPIILNKSLVLQTMYVLTNQPLTLIGVL